MNGKKILVVDDDLISNKVLSAKLIADGFTVVSARDGGAALALVREGRPDLILLDLSFPPDVAHGGGVFRDGFTLMSWIHSTQGNIPIIIITAGDAAALKDKALSTGAVHFFHKPIDTEKLLAAIRETLGVVKEAA